MGVINCLQSLYMESVSDFIEKKTESIFSKTPVLAGGSGDGVSSFYVFFGVVVLSLGFIYFFRKQIRDKMGSLLLYFHLGKKNEIRTTEIPPKSRVASMIEGLGLAEEIKPF